MIKNNDRTLVLAEAIDLINGEREAHYGTPQESFRCVADLWSAYLNYPVSPADTCHMMALLKIARLRNGKHRDSSVDAAGYLGLGFEVDS